MSNESAAHASIEKFKKELADAKAAGIKCGCNCGGFIDFEEKVNHLEHVFHPCKKCGLLHDKYGHVVFFKTFNVGYHKDSLINYKQCDPDKFFDYSDEKKPANHDPQDTPCQDINCTGRIDTTLEFHYGLKIYSLCKKCSLLHTKNGSRQIFSHPFRGYFVNGKIVFNE